jgi:hypothetical protein
MGERNIRIAVIVVNLFAALSAFAGALGLVVGYMNIPVSELRTTPFADFTVPALLLGFVVGGSALAAALIVQFGPRRVALFEPLRFDALVSAVAGCIMVGWMVIEIGMIGLDIWVQALYLVVGVVMIGLAGLLQWAETRETGVSSIHHPA